MFRSLVLASALAAATPAAPASADHGGASVIIELGVHDRDWRRGYDRGISRREAINIAYSYGVTDVRDVDLRHGIWEIRGRGHRGTRIEIEILARNGRVIDVGYGRDRGRRRGWDDYGWNDENWDRGWY